MRLAAVSDIHYRKDAEGMLRELFSQASQEADLLIICGDLTDHGTLEETMVLAEDLRRYVNIPVLALLGNHDHDAGQPEVVERVLGDVGVRMMQGNTFVLGEVGFAGAKGFIGGFDERAMGPFGEARLKATVQEGVEEALQLEGALLRLDTRFKVALTHYAPVRATLEGEPLEIIPFLGSGRLGDAIDHNHADVAFHGHAHKGAFEGRTTGGTPVFNVALPVVRQRFPTGPGFFLYELGD